MINDDFLTLILAANRGKEGLLALVKGSTFGAAAPNERKKTEHNSIMIIKRTEDSTMYCNVR